jgi:lipopolysaccharide transport protein LptA
MFALLLLALLAPPAPAAKMPAAKAPAAQLPAPQAPAATTTTAKAPAPTAPLDIRADRLELDRKAGTARFSGAVEVQQGRLVLRCAALSASYAEGEVVSLVAEGGVEVRGEDWVAHAEHAHYDREAGLLTLTGDPRIERATDVLRGERVLLWPDDERLVVEQARGRVNAPRLAVPPR